MNQHKRRVVSIFLFDDRSLILKELRRQVISLAQRRQSIHSKLSQHDSKQAAAAPDLKKASSEIPQEADSIHNLPNHSKSLETLDAKKQEPEAPKKV